MGQFIKWLPIFSSKGMIDALHWSHSRASVNISSFLPYTRYLVFLFIHYPFILLWVTAAPFMLGICLFYSTTTCPCDLGKADHCFASFLPPLPLASRVSIWLGFAWSVFSIPLVLMICWEMGMWLRLVQWESNLEIVWELWEREAHPTPLFFGLDDSGDEI